MFGRAGGVLRGNVGSAGDACPVWLVTEVHRFGGVASGEVGSSGATDPVWLVASSTGGSSRTTRDIEWDVEPFLPLTDTAVKIPDEPGGMTLSILIR